MRRRKQALIILIILVVTVPILLKGKITRQFYPIKYSDIVSKVSLDTRIPADLIYAIIRTESSFNPRAKSDVGAIGLMQITEETFDWVKFRMKDDTAVYEDLLRPEINIKYGGWLLRLLMDEFKTEANAICAYHAGWGSVTSWLANDKYSLDGINISQIPYRDTTHYLYKVQNAKDMYNKLYDLDVGLVLAKQDEN